MLADRWIVGTVLKYRRRKGRDEYLVNWIGWDSTHNTWEPVRNINNVHAIDKFWEFQEEVFGKKRPNRNRRKKGKKVKGGVNKKTEKQNERRKAKQEEIMREIKIEEEQEEDSLTPAEKREFIISHCRLPDDVILYENSVDDLYKMIQRKNFKTSRDELLEECNIYNDVYSECENALLQSNVDPQMQEKLRESKLKSQLQMEYIRDLLVPFLTAEEREISANHRYRQKQRPRKEGDPEDAPIEYYDELIEDEDFEIKKEVELDGEENWNGMNRVVKQEVEEQIYECVGEGREEDNYYIKKEMEEEEEMEMDRIEDEENYEERDEEDPFDFDMLDEEEGSVSDIDKSVEYEEQDDDTMSEGTQMDEEEIEYILSEDEEIRESLMEEAENAAREQEEVEEIEDFRRNDVPDEQEDIVQEEHVIFVNREDDVPEQIEIGTELDDGLPEREPFSMDVAVNFPEEGDIFHPINDGYEHFPQNQYNPRSPSSSTDSNISSEST